MQDWNIALAYLRDPHRYQNLSLINTVEYNYQI